MPVCAFANTPPRHIYVYASKKPPATASSAPSSRDSDICPRIRPINTPLFSLLSPQYTRKAFMFQPGRTPYVFSAGVSLPTAICKPRVRFHIFFLCHIAVKNRQKKKQRRIAAFLIGPSVYNGLVHAERNCFPHKMKNRYTTNKPVSIPFTGSASCLR